MLASSGLTLLASLLFFVSDERAPHEGPVDPRSLVGFCLPPPPRLAPQSGAGAVVLSPPPLPQREQLEVPFSTQRLAGVMTFTPGPDGWDVTLSTTPRADAPAVQVDDETATTAVHDLRWHGRAGVASPVTRRWRQKPGQA
jgi:hypothetical protein